MPHFALFAGTSHQVRTRVVLGIASAFICCAEQASHAADPPATGPSQRIYKHPVPPTPSPEPPPAPIADEVPEPPADVVAAMRVLIKAAHQRLPRPDANDDVPKVLPGDIAHQKDIVLARYVLERPLWPDLADVAMAAEILKAYGELSLDDWRLVVQASARKDAGDVMPLRRMIVAQGRSMALPITRAEPATGLDTAASLLREIAAQQPDKHAVPVELLRISLQQGEFDRVRTSAVKLLDHLTRGKDALPLPQGTVDVWLSMIHGFRTPLLGALIDALIHHSASSGFTEADRAGFELLAGIRSRRSIFLGIAPELREVKSPRMQTLLATALADHLVASELDTRNAAAGVLSQWPDGAASVSPQLARYIVSTPLYLNEPALRTLPAAHACTRVLIRNKTRSLRAAPAIAPGLLDPARREWAEGVIDAIGPAAAMPLAIDYVRLLATPASDDRRRACMLALQQPRGSIATAAQLFALRHDPSDGVRLEAVRGLRSATTNAPAVRQTLLPMLASNDEDLRLAAAATLTAIAPGDDADLVAAYQWLAAGDRTHRVAAAKLLAAAGPRVADHAIPPLLRMADNTCPIQRNAAATALAVIDPKGEKLGPAVIYSVLHNDSLMRRPLLIAVRSTPNDKLVARLQDIAENEPDPQVKVAARQTLAALK